MSTHTKGFLYGAIAAASYGMNPLFTLPLYAAGMSVDSVLFYRYLFAVIVFILFPVSLHELQLYGRWHCVDYSVCLSGHGGSYYGSIL